MASSGSRVGRKKLTPNAVLGRKDPMVRAHIREALNLYLQESGRTLRDLERATGLAYASLKSYKGGLGVPSLQAVAILIDAGVPIVLGKPPARAITATASVNLERSGANTLDIAVDVKVS